MSLAIDQISLDEFIGKLNIKMDELLDEFSIGPVLLDQFSVYSELFSTVRKMEVARICSLITCIYEQMTTKNGQLKQVKIL